MKKKSTSKSAFFNLRILIASALCLLGIAVALSPGKSKSPSNKPISSGTNQDAPARRDRTSCRWSGLSVLDQDLRKLPYVAPKAESEERRLTRYPHDGTQTSRRGPECQLASTSNAA